MTPDVKLTPDGIEVRNEGQAFYTAIFPRGFNPDTDKPYFERFFPNHNVALITPEEIQLVPKDLHPIRR